MYSYPSIYQLGHRNVRDIFLDPVIVEEKIDGSQFSFGLYPSHPGDTDLHCRSKGADINLFAPEKMFNAAVATALALVRAPGLLPQAIYRCEYLAKPRHNALAYDRVPNGHLILFDVCTGPETYMTYDEKAAEAARLGLEVVPRLHEGLIDGPGDIRALLETTSILGGQKIEGVVVKNYSRFGLDKRILIGKFVSEAFKEVHRAEWKNDNPQSGDILTRLCAEYRSQARWQKAVQHLTEQGRLCNEPRDIGLLFKEVPEDIKRECEDEIKEQLFAWAWPHIRRGATTGLPEWYKERLLLSNFDASS